MVGKCFRTGGSNKLHSWTKRSGKLSKRNNANHNKSIALFSLTNQQRRGGGGGGDWVAFTERENYTQRGRSEKDTYSLRISLQPGSRVGFWARFRFANSPQLPPSGGIRREKGACWRAKREQVIPIHNLIHLSLDVLLRTLLFLIFQMPGDRKHVPGKSVSMSKSPARMKIVVTYTSISTMYLGFTLADIHSKERKRN